MFQKLPTRHCSPAREAWRKPAYPEATRPASQEARPKRRREEGDGRACRREACRLGADCVWGAARGAAPAAKIAPAGNAGCSLNVLRPGCSSWATRGGTGSHLESRARPEPEPSVGKPPAHRRELSRW